MLTQLFPKFTALFARKFLTVQLLLLLCLIHEKLCHNTHGPPHWNSGYNTNNYQRLSANRQTKNANNKNFATTVPSNVRRDDGTALTTAKCQCIRKEGSKECFEYDMRKQAGSFEEAVIYFPEVLLAQPDTTQMKPASDKNSVKFWCDRSRFCKECADALMTHVHLRGDLSGEELAKKRKEFGFNDSTIDLESMSYCWRLQYSKSHQGDNCKNGQHQPPPPPPNQHPPPPNQRPGPPPNQKPPPAPFPNNNPWEQNANRGPPPAKNCNNKNKNNFNTGNNNNNANKVGTEKLVEDLIAQGNDLWQNVSKQNRGKRQSVDSATEFNITTENLGEVFQIDCLKRGEVVDPDGEFISLCNICWVWRRLPSDYFPTYLNEFVCDADRKCLSGFGECKQRTRPVDVMRNFGTEANPIWRVITIGSPVFCECEARFGTQFQSLVSA